MSEWKTLKQETVEVGGNNFLEINLINRRRNKTIKQSKFETIIVAQMFIYT